jgi:hypothetical protein
MRTQTASRITGSLSLFSPFSPPPPPLLLPLLRGKTK